MEKSRKTLGEYGWVLLILAVYDVIMSIVKNIVEFSEIQTVWGAISSDIASVVTTITIIVLVVWVVFVIAQIYLGVVGIKLSRGTYAKKSNAPVVIAQIMSIIQGILAIIIAIELLTTPNFEIEMSMSMTFCIIDEILLISYAKHAKTALASL